MCTTSLPHTLWAPKGEQADEICVPNCGVSRGVRLLAGNHLEVSRGAIHPPLGNHDKYLSPCARSQHPPSDRALASYPRNAREEVIKSTRGRDPKTRNQIAKVLPVSQNPLRVGGQKDRNGCEFRGKFDLFGMKTGNTSCLKWFPVCPFWIGRSHSFESCAGAKFLLINARIFSCQIKA